MATVALAQRTDSEAGNPAATGIASPQNGVSDGSLDKLLDMADKDVSQLSQVKVAGQPYPVYTLNPYLVLRLFCELAMKALPIDARSVGCDKSSWRNVILIAAKDLGGGAVGCQIFRCAQDDGLEAPSPYRQELWVHPKRF